MPEKNNKFTFHSSNSGSSGSVSSVGGIGMSPIERIRNIKAMQKLSPFTAINEALKKIDLKSFGLGQKIFEASEEEMNKTLTQINRIKKKEQEYNYHIPGLTKNVSGQEIPIHSISQHNAKIRDVNELIQEQKGGFVATDWSPKVSRGFLHQKTDHPQTPGQIR